MYVIILLNNDRSLLNIYAFYFFLIMSLVFLIQGFIRIVFLIVNKKLSTFTIKMALIQVSYRHI